MIRLSLITFLSLLFLASCREDESWKKPADVQLHIGLHSDSVLRNNDFVFDTAQLALSGLLVQGEHEELGALSFSRDVDQSLQLVRLEAEQALADFQIPAGAYNSLKVGICLTASPDGAPNLAVKGYFDYGNPNWEPAVVEFQKNTADTLWFEVANTQFDPLDTRAMSLQINPPYWFRNTKSRMMQQAAFTQAGNRRAVRINSQNNRRIYDEISAQIGKEEIARLRE